MPSNSLRTVCGLEKNIVRTQSSRKYGTYHGIPLDPPLFLSFSVHARVCI